MPDIPPRIVGSMVVAHRLTGRQARRIAVSAQLLDRPRPTDLVEVVRRLTLLQLDPVAAVAQSADLVLWSRLGRTYRPANLERALANHELIELRALIRPAEDIALYRGEMDRRRAGLESDSGFGRGMAWLSANDAARRDILRRLDRDGPLPSRELPDTCSVAWQSSGWTNDKNVTRMLELMELTGEVAITGRRGRERLWDLAPRVHPDVPAVPVEDAIRVRNERRLRALGIARARAPQMPMEPVWVGDAGEPAVVDGVAGEWRVDPAGLDRVAPERLPPNRMPPNRMPPGRALPGPAQSGPAFSGRVALLSPFDRLIHDRRRAVELFGFDYQLEMYKPAAARRWGYYALPILSGDRLVGKLDAKADREAGILRVNAVHADEPFAPRVSAAVDREIGALAGWLGLEVGG
jgi:uncharacterized protein YcaQ